MQQQERMREESIKKIMEAFLVCLEEKSFQKLTVTEIIALAEVNRSTFYKYFRDKYELKEIYLKMILDDFYKNTNYGFITAKSNEIQNEIHSQNFEKILNFFDNKKKIYRILWESDMDSNLFQKMIQIHKDNILRTIQTDPMYWEKYYSYGELYADLFAYNCMMTVRWWIEHETEIEKEEVGIIMRENMEKGFFQTYRRKMETGEFS